MAAITLAGSTWNTTAGNKTVVATPSIGDLIVVVHGMSGWAGGDTSVITDDQGGTYDQVGGNPLSTGGGTASALWISIRRTKIPAASSTTFTCTNVGDTGGGLTVFRVSGMQRTGAAAARQNVGESTQTENPPSIDFPAAVLTENPVILAVLGEDNPPALTSPSGFAEHLDSGWATPTTGIQICSDDSGNTASSYAWTGGALTDHNEVGVELDTSAPVVLRPIVPQHQLRQRSLTTAQIATASGSMDADYAYNLNAVASACYPATARRETMPVPIQPTGTRPTHVPPVSAPDASWQQRYPDTARRPALTAALMNWSEQHFGVTIHIPALSWTGNTLHPATLHRVATHHASAPAAPFVFTTAAPAPDLSWQPRLVDRTDRRALWSSQFGGAVTAESLGTWPVPDRSWQGVYPDTTRRAALTTAAVNWAAQHFGVTVHIPAGSWNGNTLEPDVLRRVRTQAALTQVMLVPQQITPPPTPDLSWQPRLVDRTARARDLRRGEWAEAPFVAPPQLVDFVFDYRDPVRQMRSRVIPLHATWFDDLNWDLIAIASARYPTWPLLRPRAVRAPGVNQEQPVTAPQVVDFVFDFLQPIRPVRARSRATVPSTFDSEKALAAPPVVQPLGSVEPLPSRRRSNINLAWAQQHFGVEIIVPVMAWESYTSLYPAMTRRAHGVSNRAGSVSLTPVIQAPPAPELAWQPRVPHTTSRARLGVAQMQPAEVMTERTLVVLAPELSWQPTYPDAPWRPVLTPALQPFTVRAEALGQFAIPALSWAPRYPETTWRARLTVAQMQATEAMTERAIVAVAPDLSWQPTHPDRTWRPRLAVSLMPWTARAEALAQLPVLLWPPVYPDTTRRQTLREAVRAAGMAPRGEAIEQFEVPPLSWLPTFPDTTRRESLAVALMMGAGWLTEFAAPLVTVSGDVIVLARADVSQIQARADVSVILARGGR